MDATTTGDRILGWAMRRAPARHTPNHDEPHRHRPALESCLAESSDAKRLAIYMCGSPVGAHGEAPYGLPGLDMLEQRADRQQLREDRTLSRVGHPAHKGLRSDAIGM